MGVSLQVLITSVLVISGFFILVISLAVKAYRRKPQTGDKGILGEAGRVHQKITPDHPGRVFVHGEIWNARSDETIEPGRSSSMEKSGMPDPMRPSNPARSWRLLASNIFF